MRTPMFYWAGALPVRRQPRYNCQGNNRTMTAKATTALRLPRRLDNEAVRVFHLTLGILFIPLLQQQRRGKQRQEHGYPPPLQLETPTSDPT